MIFVNIDFCNGCGECVSVCPNGAMILKDNLAFIDQELCQECEVCVDSCPKGAILVAESAPIDSEIIRVPAELPIVSEQPRYTSIQNAVLPAIGSALMWTGREVIPRLANLAINYLEQRLQSSPSEFTHQNIKRRNRRPSGQRGKGRRRRQHQRRKMYK